MVIAFERTEHGIAEPARHLPIAREVDVLVVGGGTSGCMAAVAAAREGARVMLVERYGFLGGTATAAMVGVFCGVYTCGPDATHQLLVGGLPRQVMQRLEAIGGGHKYRHRFQVDHEIFKVVLDQMVIEAGVEMLLHATVVETLREGSNLCGVVVEHKGGREAILAHRIIDASGDGDVAALAGAPWESGDEDGRLQAPTMVFYMGRVDVERADLATLKHCKTISYHKASKNPHTHLKSPPTMHKHHNWAIHAITRKRYHCWQTKFSRLYGN